MHSAKLEFRPLSVFFFGLFFVFLFQKTEKGASSRFSNFLFSVSQCQGPLLNHGDKVKVGSRSAKIFSCPAGRFEKKSTEEHRNSDSEFGSQYFVYFLND